METAIFASCCFAYWTVIAALAVIQTKQRATPGTNPGTSVVGFFVIAAIAFAIGLALNEAVRNLGFWAVGIAQAAYMIWGLLDELAYRKRNKLKP